MSAEVPYIEPYPMGGSDPEPLRREEIMVLQGKSNTISEIQKSIEEYAGCRDERDSRKVAVQIYYCVFGSQGEDYEIAENIRSFWIGNADLAEKFL